MIRTLFLATAMGLALTSAVYAQTVNTETQRDVNQQQRVEQGLQSGQLGTGEAARLENGEAHIDHMQQNALKYGSLSPAEAARINKAQNAESARIYDDKHNAVAGNPNSASSQRMQADVQRNVNQQSRINQGVRSGALTNKETAHLERGQAHVDKREARAGRDGHVGPHEQRRIQTADNHQSQRIYHQKHDGQTRP